MNVALIAIGVGLIFFIVTYNSLVHKKNQIENAEGSLDAVLKQRFDLIPQLIEVAKQYMTHEEVLLSKIIELRSRATKSHDLAEKDGLDKQMQKELKGLMVNVENYPQLLSNNNFTQLQEAMTDLEKNISASRRFYNTAVVEFNTAIEMFPGFMLRGLMGLAKKERFSVGEDEKIIPNTRELFKK